MDEFHVILFHSSNYVMWAAKILKKKGLRYRIIPIPRQLSSDCGYCLQIPSADVEEAKKLITLEALNTTG
jgi:hypothetical protein